MTNEFRYTKITDGKIEELVIKEINAEEKKNRKLIGKAAGISLPHCVSMGRRYGADFEKRAKYYHFSGDFDESLEKLRNQGCIVVEFYE